MPRLIFVPILLSLAFASACASGPQYIKGTKVEDTTDNKRVLSTVEAYRTALEARDASKLVMLASEKYWDDAGTPAGNDDYGYSQLKDILANRLQRASDIRYSLRYRRIRWRGEKAFVDVLIDASFTVVDADGKPSRRDLRDRNQFVLVRDGDGYKFLSGM